MNVISGKVDCRKFLFSVKFQIGEIDGDHFLIMYLWCKQGDSL